MDDCRGVEMIQSCWSCAVITAVRRRVLSTEMHWATEENVFIPSTEICLHFVPSTPMGDGRSWAPERRRAEPDGGKWWSVLIAVTISLDEEEEEEEEEKEEEEEEEEWEVM